MAAVTSVTFYNLVDSNNTDTDTAEIETILADRFPGAEIEVINTSNPFAENAVYTDDGDDEEAADGLAEYVACRMNGIHMTDKLYTTRDIADRFGYSPKHAVKIARKIAQAYGLEKLGRDWLIPAELVEAWVPAHVGHPKGDGKMDKRILKASDVGLQHRANWIVDLSPIRRDMDYFKYFSTLVRAENFLSLIDRGMGVTPAIALANSWRKAEYIGEFTCTRGEYGESVQSGRVDPDGYVYVWDSGYGWSCWGKATPENWRITDQVVEAIKEDY